MVCAKVRLTLLMDIIGIDLLDLNVGMVCPKVRL